ncbi:MAG TPA: phosphoribosylaminoimidazolesuccinocarboxamide synthase [Gammaproteobacteria bacterium]
MNDNTLFESRLTSLPLLGRGKVRDLYQADDRHMLIVTTDRLSAFDVILPAPVPGKGRILTEISRFWFNKLAHIVPSHMADLPLARFLNDDEIRQLDGRGMLVRKLKPLPVEAVVRGYLIGSGWNDYRAAGAVCGITLPSGLEQAARLPEPIFTPATKADIGEHDENISFEQVAALIGDARAAELRDISLRLYKEAAEYARQRGIIIADTKFEFGLDESGRLVWIDEALTPDSSRFWPLDGYRTGISPPSFDKQYVRDYLETLDWNKTAPGPRLPEDVLRQTAEKYREALTRLTGPG